MHQHAVGTRPQLDARDLAHWHFPVGHRHARLERAAPGRAEYQRQPGFVGLGGRGAVLHGEAGLHRTGPLGRLDFQIGTADQGVEMLAAHQAKLRTHHPEAAAGTGDLLTSLLDAYPQEHPLQIVAQGHLLDAADLQATVAQRRAGLQSVTPRQTQFQPVAAGQCLLFVVEQAQAFHPRHRSSLRIGRIEGDAAKQQGLQRLAMHFDTTQSTLEANATGVPEAGRFVDQPGVVGFDVHADQYLLVVTRQLVALHAADAHLPV